MKRLTISNNISDNPSWPPTLNRYIIIVGKIDDNVYIGKVIKNLQNNIGCIIGLAKGFKYEGDNNHIKPYLKSSANLSKFMIIDDDYIWRYIPYDMLEQYLNSYDITNSKNKIGERLYDGLYDGLDDTESSLRNKFYANASFNPDIKNIRLADIIDDLDDFSFLSNNNSPLIVNTKLINSDLAINDIYDPETIEDVIPDKVKIYRKDIINALENNTDTNTNTNTNIKDVLIVDQMMISHFVNNHTTLEKEADKIINYLRTELHLSGDNIENNEEKLFSSLRFIYYNGYVHIFRVGIPLKEIITKELLGDKTLEILGENEYGIPIRHNVLKYILFQNEVQASFNADQKLLTEAKLILSQEYIIALTPEPRYQLWCVLRLIKLWFGDIDLQNNIRKIKLIVNQFRSRSDITYNINNGIRFSIGVYPRYGRKSATIVLKKLIYYFAVYGLAIGWKNNPPSFFKIVNDLISYTNCDQSLKLYYRHISQKNINIHDNKIFNKNYTLINNTGNNTDILEQYIRL